MKGVDLCPSWRFSVGGDQGRYVSDHQPKLLQRVTLPSTLPPSPRRDPNKSRSAAAHSFCEADCYLGISRVRPLLHWCFRPHAARPTLLTSSLRAFTPSLLGSTILDSDRRSNHHCSLLSCAIAHYFHIYGCILIQRPDLHFWLNPPANCSIGCKLSIPPFRRPFFSADDKVESIYNSDPQH
jgi:hypothetical protein